MNCTFWRYVFFWTSCLLSHSNCLQRWITQAKNIARKVKCVSEVNNTTVLCADHRNKPYRLLGIYSGHATGLTGRQVEVRFPAEGLDRLWRPNSLLLNRYREPFHSWYSNWGGNLTTHFHLVPTWRKPKAIPLLPNKPSWRGALLNKRKNFTGFIYAEFVNSNNLARKKEWPFVEFSTASIQDITRCYLQRIHEGCMLDEEKCACDCLLYWHYIFECVETVSVWVRTREQ